MNQQEQALLLVLLFQRDFLQGAAENLLSDRNVVVWVEMAPEFGGAVGLEGALERGEEVVADERLEAVVAEAVDVRSELRARREVSGAVEEGFGGGAEGGVALGDFVEGGFGECVEIGKLHINRAEAIALCKTNK